MGCDCCNKWDWQDNRCTASVQFRRMVCDQNLPEHRNSNYTRPKKRRKRK